MDEKSLIKKYQKEISSLKQELHQIKRGMMENPSVDASTQEDLVNLKLQVCSAMHGQPIIYYQCTVNVMLFYFFPNAISFSFSPSLFGCIDIINFHCAYYC